jgi:hypothetical protein
MTCIGIQEAGSIWREKSKTYLKTIRLQNYDARLDSSVTLSFRGEQNTRRVLLTSGTKRKHLQ